MVMVNYSLEIQYIFSLGVLSSVDISLIKLGASRLYECPPHAISDIYVSGIILHSSGYLITLRTYPIARDTDLSKVDRRMSISLTIHENSARYQ